MSKTQAIVIGGSIAGLLTARVLSTHFDTVTIIERDTLSETPDVRNGAPQGHHIHLLLSRGQDIMEEMLPGLTEDLNATGVPRAKWGLETITVTMGGELQRLYSGIETSVPSRPALEYLIRKRVRQTTNIEWRTQTQVECLLHEDSRIVGVKLLDRHTKDISTLNANLVVDASGRGSKTPEWLQGLGYDAPEETHVDAFMGYATRWFEVPETYQPDWKMMLILGDTKSNNLRQGGIFRVEGNRYIVTLQGINKDYPPNDEDEFIEFAKTLEAPYFYEFLKIATPITPIYGYRRTHNQVRHYEKLTRRPENLVILGDAYCGFNPVYGQGMSVAAMQVQELGKVLVNYNVTQLDGFADEFQKRLLKVIETPWMMATAEDLRYPLTEGDEPNLMVRIMQVYSSWISETVAHDLVITKAWVQMMNLQLDGLELLHPQILFRVLWHKFLRPKGKRPLQHQAKPIVHKLRIVQKSQD